MRTLDLRVPCPCAAATFWALREERAWDEASAAADGQRYVPEAVRRAPAPPRGERVERVSRLEQRWPPALLAVLGNKADEFAVRVTTSWYTGAHDRAHPCHLAIHVPALGSRFAVRGRLWVEPAGPRACDLCTSYEIAVRAPSFVAARVEAAIEAKMRATYADQPRRVLAYLAARPPPCVAAHPVAAPSPGAIPVEAVVVAW